ncbi:MAG: glutathione S-transferase family protein [Gammaproteobacteria bacterium]|nr:glutathione S-transferase family protein [Gammaproteobacteria bacterium]RZV53412.1 MAG: glutathione S-transferase family protein [Pseudomonadales bacterium]
MITLFTFPAAFGLRNVSPFCLKVEMALAYLKLDFEIALESDPRKGPKAKLPFIISDGVTFDDSELILKHLDEITNGGLYAELSPDEIAVGTAFTRLADDHLYWIMVASRWLEDDWFPNVQQGFFGSLPPVIAPLIARMARRQMRQTYHLHGLGRHTREQQEWFARSDLQAIAAVVSKDEYIVGKRLTVYDFNVASLLAGVLDNKPATWLTKIANAYPSLATYAERIQREVNVYCRHSE